MTTGIRGDVAPVVRRGADEVMVAVAKTRQEGAIRQQLIEELMRQIKKYDDEFRRQEATGAIGSHSRHYTRCSKRRVACGTAVTRCRPLEFSRRIWIGKLL